jgi:hypothetical protein
MGVRISRMTPAHAGYIPDSGLRVVRFAPTDRDKGPAEAIEINVTQAAHGCPRDHARDWEE